MTRSFNRPFLVMAMLMLCVCGGPVIAQAQDLGTTPVLADKSPAAELAYWNTIKNSDRPEDYKSYLENFPDGMFYDNALAQFEKSGGNKSELSAGKTADVPATAPAVDAPETDVKTPVTATVTKSTAKKSATVKTKKRTVVIKKKKSSGTATAKKTKAKKAKKTKKAKVSNCRYGRNKDGSCIKKTKKNTVSKPKKLPYVNEDGGGEARGGGWNG